MAGNSKRKGAVRKDGSKKGAVVGSGGRGRRALEGKGPTPKAEDRVYHVAHKRKGRAEAAEAKSTRRPSGPSDRTSASAELVVGRNSVVEVMRAGMPARELLVHDRIDADDRVAEAVSIALESGVEVREVTKAKLDAETGGAVHQGLALRVPPYEYADFDALLGGPGVPLVVALDSIQDPRNLGAILRSAAAFGATGVLIPERRAAAVTVAAWKVSAGAAARVPVARVVNLTRALGDLKKEGFFVVGLAADGEMPVAASQLLVEPLVLVVGSEGQGLSRLVRDACDQVVSIPIAASTESLNASVAAAVALYETSSRRTSPPTASAR